jgi:hypothetical protein
VVAGAPAALLHPPKRPSEPATTRIFPGTRIVAATARPVVVASTVVVAKAEEPHEPHDEQPDIEDAEAHHEDPSLGGHRPMLQRTKAELKAPKGMTPRHPEKGAGGHTRMGQRRFLPDVVFVVLVFAGLGMYVAL